MTPEQSHLYVNSVDPLAPEVWRNNINTNNPIFMNFNRQIRQMVDLWETLSSEEQRIYRMRPENVLPHPSGRGELFSVYRTSYSTYIRNILNTTDSDCNIIKEFIRVLSILDTTYNYWTSDERSLYDNSVNPNNTEQFRNEINSRNCIFSDYNKLMREALGYWRAMSPDKQRNIRIGPHINNPNINTPSSSMLCNVVWGGPISRIISIRLPTHPAEIYDVL
jgi:hypothetical protein